MSYTCDPGTPRHLKVGMSFWVIFCGFCMFLSLISAARQQNEQTVFQQKGLRAITEHHRLFLHVDQRHPASNSPVFSGRKWGQDCVTRNTSIGRCQHCSHKTKKHTSYKIPDNSPLLNVYFEVRVVFNIHLCMIFV